MTCGVTSLACSPPRGLFAFCCFAADLCRSFTQSANLEDLWLPWVKKLLIFANHCGLLPGFLLCIKHVKVGMPSVFKWIIRCFLDVSIPSSQSAVSNAPCTASVASPHTAAQPPPECLASIVQAASASIAAEPTPVLLSQSYLLPACAAVAGTSGSLLPLSRGISSQDFGAQAPALLASGTGLLLPSSLAMTSCSQGGPAIVASLFASTFVPPNTLLASS